jgi:hypothetical protein
VLELLLHARKDAREIHRQETVLYLERQLCSRCLRAFGPSVVEREVESSVNVHNPREEQLNFDRLTHIRGDEAR